MIADLVVRGADVWMNEGFRRAEVAIAGGRIVEVGASISGECLDSIDCSGMLVLPGLVNAHTHAHSVLARGMLDVGCLEVLINNVDATTVGRSPEETYLAAASNAIEMLRFGVTSACDQFATSPIPTEEHLAAAAQAYRDVGLRATIAPLVGDLGLDSTIPGLSARIPAHLRRAPRGPETAWGLDSIAAFDLKLRDAGDDLIQVGVAPSIAVSCSDKLLEACASVALDRDLPIFTHLTESKAEAAASHTRFGQTATAYLDKIGLLGRRTVLAHGVWVTADDLDLIADSQAIIVHAPASNLRLGSGIAPVAAMLRRGIRVALGTDGATCSDNQNLFEAMRQAALVSRVLSFGNDEWLSARQALGLAIEGGGAALGLDDLGQVAAGYRADLTIITRQGLNPLTAGDIVTQLVFGSPSLGIHTVIVAGRVVLHAGRVVGVDEHAIQEAASEAARAMRARNTELWRWATEIGPHIQSACAAASLGAEWPPGVAPFASASLALGTPAI